MHTAVRILSNCLLCKCIYSFCWKHLVTWIKSNIAQLSKRGFVYFGKYAHFDSEVVGDFNVDKLSAGVKQMIKLFEVCEIVFVGADIIIFTHIEQGLDGRILGEHHCWRF